MSTIELKSTTHIDPSVEGHSKQANAAQRRAEQDLARTENLTNDELRTALTHIPLISDPSLPGAQN